MFEHEDGGPVASEIQQDIQCRLVDHGDVPTGAVVVRVVVVSGVGGWQVSILSVGTGDRYMIMLIRLLFCSDQDCSHR